MKPTLKTISLICATLLPSMATAATLIVPVFGNTSSQYRRVVSAANDQELIAIINPDNGPGSSRSGKTGRFVNQIQDTGSLAVGYINTNYGSRDIGDIRSEIDRYVSYYGADGIFLDEFSDSVSDISLYRDIFKYAKSKDLKVIGNPGTFLPKAFAKYADMFITYEDYYDNGFKNFKQKSWTKKSNKQFGVIVQGTNDYQAVINKADQQDVEFVFVTDGDYGSLGSDFSGLSGAVKGRGGKVSAVPEPSAMALLGLGLVGMLRRKR